MFRAGHCICREYHNPDEHEHDEDEQFVSTCSSQDGGKLVKKCRKPSGVSRYSLRLFGQAGIEITYASKGQ
jgi:hypothetical protein